jgi:hypothetical protein
MSGARSAVAGRTPGRYITDALEAWRADALKKGWLLRQWDDPASTPVQLWDGVFYLSDDGLRVPAPETKEAS